MKERRRKKSEKEEEMKDFVMNEMNMKDDYGLEGIKEDE